MLSLAYESGNIIACLFVYILPLLQSFKMGIGLLEEIAIGCGVTAGALMAAKVYTVRYKNAKISEATHKLIIMFLRLQLLGDNEEEEENQDAIFKILKNISERDDFKKMNLKEIRSLTNKGDDDIKAMIKQCIDQMNSNQLRGVLVTMKLKDLSELNDLSEKKLTIMCRLLLENMYDVKQNSSSTVKILGQAFKKLKSKSGSGSKTGSKPNEMETGSKPNEIESFLKQDSSVLWHDEKKSILKRMEKFTKVLKDFQSNE